MSRRRERTADPRDRGGLWPLAAAPSAWLLHFVACYVTAAVACAKAAPGAPLGDARVALWVLTAIAFAVIAATGAWSWRRHRAGDAARPHDAATMPDRRRFIGFATFLLCVLSAIAVGYSTLVFVAIGTCR